MKWMLTVGSWAIFIVTIFVYTTVAHPHAMGIDFFSTALGALVVTWLVAAALVGLVAVVYKVMKGAKLQGFGVAAPLVATGLVIAVLFALY